MDMLTCVDYVQNYLSWLKGSFVVESCNDKYCHIITPFLRESHDHIEVFIEKQGDDIILTDDGTTFEYLFLNGIDINTPTRKQYISSISKRTNTIFDDCEIKSYVDYSNNFGIAFSNFINAIVSVSNLTYTGVEKDKSTFRDDLKNFLYNKGIDFKALLFSGYSCEYKFDFVIIRPKPVIIEPITSSSPSLGLNMAKKTAFQWEDLRKTNNNFCGISLINDKEDIWTPEIMNILDKNSDKTISWSNRDEILKEAV
ncbi:MAG: DUF1828 domain-containing protein [Deltaproteobacteria bacterium]